MLTLRGKMIYLATLEREHCKKLWESFEYDFNQVTEPLNVGYSVEKADDWFLEIQNHQGNKHIRLGIFLSTGEVIGDIALQDIDWRNRSCSLGYGLAKLEHRGKGYVTDATMTILNYGMNHLGIERVSANCLESNIGSQRVLEKCGFILEGTERQAVYLGGKKQNRFCYGILKEEFLKN